MADGGFDFGAMQAEQPEQPAETAPLDFPMGEVATEVASIEASIGGFDFAPTAEIPAEPAPAPVALDMGALDFSTPAAAEPVWFSCASHSARVLRLLSEPSAESPIPKQ
jgi:hypothetical protein